MATPSARRTYVLDTSVLLADPAAVVPLAAAATWAPDGNSRAGPGSLADRAATVLTDEIVAGTLRPGQWVSENELAARLGVSRSPVREALRALARDGLVAVRCAR